WSRVNNTDLKLFPSFVCLQKSLLNDRGFGIGDYNISVPDLLSGGFSDDSSGGHHFLLNESVDALSQAFLRFLIGNVYWGTRYFDLQPSNCISNGGCVGSGGVQVLNLRAEMVIQISVERGTWWGRVIKDDLL